ncbi:hypothetical protein K437DRAFT_99626 [Tilletiaria anomala UBC 951]|uniref:Six-hairpin glycosidase n=1 Tax=Tilletiaria anomala (strain ATCC 24038 / CBS 436.72 / UBC 951) TaxID=1037660 RepID=A0A066W494_TILAU|nr:uncharacterized protein K437DRAFT_99626 [Tilletiaria anomala UBC 951]KDN47333.1 hypothetical protein K437DRAFT_99626 [Tilletiaria anomala UBC 951]
MRSAFAFLAALLAVGAPYVLLLSTLAVSGAEAAVSPLRAHRKVLQARRPRPEPITSLETGRYSPVTQPNGKFNALSFNDIQPAGLALGFNLSRVVQSAMKMSQHSWEYGTVAQMLLEVYDAPSSVFGSNASASAFPFGKVPRVPISTSPSLTYGKEHITIPSSTSTELIHGDGSAGDPASLGVAATMIGIMEPKYASAAQRQLDHLLRDVPRWPNGAISHREDKAVLWADFMAMVPPFIAFQAVAQNNTELMQTAVEQIALYRDVLRTSPTSAGAGAWQHIVGPEAQSLGIWTTGNAWAAVGMVRVLATMQNWPATADWTAQQKQVRQYIYEILDSAQHFSGLGDSTSSISGSSAIGLDASNGLLRGYLIGGYKGSSDTSATWPGEITGTAGLVASIYRIAILDPPGAAKYIAMADTLRNAVAAAVDPRTGIAKPAMSPYAWWDPQPAPKGSPEGQAMVAMMGAAYRECITASVCSNTATSTSGSSSS